MFIVESPKRIDQLVAIIERLTKKKAHCIRRADRMDANIITRSVEFETTGECTTLLDYYRRWGFDSAEERQEAEQCDRLIARASRLLGMEG